MQTTSFPVYAIVLAVIFTLHCFGDPPATPKEITQTEGNGTTTKMIYQSVPEQGIFELKETDKNGVVTQWYQHFLDSQGKEIIQIARKLPNTGIPEYESIQLITTYTYNADGNISESYEYFGNGLLRRHVIYKYDSDGKWLRGNVYDAHGKSLGEETTAPDDHLYHKK
jgi:hypothetical protein